LCAVRQAALGPVTLWCAPEATHRHFRALARGGGLQAVTQPAGDLGARLRHAMHHHFARDPGTPLLMVGTDCPLLAPGHLQQAAAALVRHDAVLIPAADGGYVLIGLRRPLEPVFAAIAWSTPQVLAQTRERLQAIGASWCELAPLWDVDEAQDWQRWQDLLAPGAGVGRQPG
jgi:rSAM/selenodomain-associated transferase 1